MLKGFRLHLVNNDGVIAKCGARVWPNKAPQNASAPYVTFRVTNSTPYRHLRGSCGLRATTVDVTVHGTTFDSTREAADAVYEAIGKDGFSGEWSGHEIHVAWWDDDSTSIQSPLFADDYGFHEISLTLEVRHKPQG